MRAFSAATDTVATPAQSADIQQTTDQTAAKRVIIETIRAL